MSFLQACRKGLYLMWGPKQYEIVYVAEIPHTSPSLSTGKNESNIPMENPSSLLKQLYMFRFPCLFFFGVFACLERKEEKKEIEYGSAYSHSTYHEIYLFQVIIKMANVGKTGNWSESGCLLMEFISQFFSIIWKVYSQGVYKS